MKDYRFIPDLVAYAEGLDKVPVSKFQRINAVKAQGGEEIETIASDGTKETTNIASAGDYIVNNVSNPDNRWIIDAKTFEKKYQIDPENVGVYMPKGGPMMAARLDEAVSFVAPWGEKMYIDKGGYLLQDPGNSNDVYGISGPDFEATYRFDIDEIQQTVDTLELIDRFELAQNSKTSSAYLAVLAKEEAWRVRQEVARNRNTDIDTLKKLANDDRMEVSRDALNNPSLDVDTLLEITTGSFDENTYLACTVVASNPKAPAQVLESIAEQSVRMDDLVLKKMLAENPGTPEKVLMQDLANDDNVDVKRIVSRNRTFVDAVDRMTETINADKPSTARKLRYDPVSGFKVVYDNAKQLERKATLDLNNNSLFVHDLKDPRKVVGKFDFEKKVMIDLRKDISEQKKRLTIGPKR